jgi:hypothetical protein
LTTILLNQAILENVVLRKRGGIKDVGGKKIFQAAPLIGGHIKGMEQISLEKK